MGIIVGSPLQQGALARCYEEQVRAGAPWLSPPRREQFEKLYALVGELCMPLPELALRFVLSNPDITTVTEWPRELRSERLSSSFRRSWHRYQSLGPAVLKCLDHVPDKDAGSEFLIRQ